MTAVNFRFGSGKVDSCQLCRLPLIFPENLTQGNENSTVRNRAEKSLYPRRNGGQRWQAKATAKGLSGMGAMVEMRHQAQGVTQPENGGAHGGH